MKPYSLVLTLALVVVHGAFAVNLDKGNDSSVAGNKEVITQTGLKYVELAEGTGSVANQGMAVTCNYTIWLQDGKKVDSSLDRQQPFTFRLDGKTVIRGMDEGVTGMKVGGKRKLTIPANLGYGANGVGNSIPANSVLIMQVEVLKVAQ